MAFTRSIRPPFVGIQFTISQAHLLAVEDAIGIVSSRIENLTQDHIGILHNLLSCILYDADPIVPAKRPYTQEDADIDEHICNG